MLLSWYGHKQRSLAHPRAAVGTQQHCPIAFLASRVCLSCQADPHAGQTCFLQSGPDGLDTYHPGQKATVLTPALRARILSTTRKKPSDGSTHWSCRKLATALGVSKDAVHRVWKEAGLKPHRLERYLASDDPEFESKAADIIGLYLRPPQHAAVFCVDEKTATQALDRLDPVLPLSPGRAERHGFEYYRHGTLS